MEAQQQETAQIVQQIKEKVRKQSKQFNKLSLLLIDSEVRQLKANDTMYVTYVTVYYNYR